MIALLLAAGLIIQGIFLAGLRRENLRLSAENTALNATYSSEYLTLNSVTLARFYQMMETDADFIVCVSRPDCGTCRTYESELLEIYDELGITESVYYLNVAELHRDAEAWAAFKQRFGIGGTPSFIHIRAGETVSSTGWTEADGISMDDVRDWLCLQEAS